MELSAVALLAIGLVVFLGRKLSRAVQKNAPDSDLLAKVTPAGTVLMAVIVAFWVICAVTRVFSPETWLGSSLGSIDGFGAVVVVSIIVAGIAAAVLEKLGIPVAKRGGRGV